MDYREQITLHSKSTMGYKEAENKDSFMTGVCVAISLSKELYDSEMERLQKLVDMYKNYYDEVKGDLTTLSSIISKHSQEY